MDPPGVKTVDVEGVEVWNIADPGGAPGDPEGREVRPLPSSDWRISATINPELAELAIDGDPATRWGCECQDTGHALTVDLSSQNRVRAIEIAHGRNRSAFPRGLVVELSTADGGWQIVADRQLDRLPIEAFLRPLEFPLLVEFEPTVTRFLRLTNTEPHDADPWLISEIRIW
jgi:hypothetical protein